MRTSNITVHLCVIFAQIIKFLKKYCITLSSETFFSLVNISWDKHESSFRLQVKWLPWWPCLSIDHKVHHQRSDTRSQWGGHAVGYVFFAHSSSILNSVTRALNHHFVHPCMLCINQRISYLPWLYRPWLYSVLSYRGIVTWNEHWFCFTVNGTQVLMCASRVATWLQVIIVDFSLCFH